MIQYGDITILSGHTLEPVDLIIGGSPCQNLSIAGNHKGLEGSESRLFYEMIRIIQEMREETNGNYPRYALFENVTGAFNSNEGRDFSIILGEFSRLIEPDAPNMSVPKEGWRNSGVLLVGVGQIAWRTHDAQYWGVPQRRKRISLAVDLRGQSAVEILFERKGVSGYSEQSKAEKKKNTRTVGKGSEGANKMSVFDSQPYHDYREIGDICQCVSAHYGTGGNNMPFVDNEGEQHLMTFQAFGVDSEGKGVASTIKATDNKHITDLVLTDTERMITVRRLTPLEAERLQGLPDNWTNIPGASDSQRYRCIGNGIALPFWEHLAKRFAQYGVVRTIGSLFDGIGSFPLVFKRAGCETLWTSEIDPFCQKVVAYHIEHGDL